MKKTKRTAKEIILENEFNEGCVLIYGMNYSKRGYKQLLRDCIGRYDADIIIKTPIHELTDIFRKINSEKTA